MRCGMPGIDVDRDLPAMRGYTAPEEVLEGIQIYSALDQPEEAMRLKQASSASTPAPSGGRWGARSGALAAQGLRCRATCAIHRTCCSSWPCPSSSWAA